MSDRFAYTTYSALLKVLDPPNAITIKNSKPHRRAEEQRQELIEKTWILSLDKSIEAFARAISDNSDSLYLAIKWDRYFAKKHGVQPKKLPVAPKKEKKLEGASLAIRSILLS